MINHYTSSSYDKETPMRDVFHKVRETVGGRGKIIVIAEHAEDKQCITDLRKKFIYVVKEVDADGGMATPQIHIEKSFDSKTCDEYFAMRVRGLFHVYRNRRMLKIGYSHILKIRLHWKSKNASPKKSVTMA